MNKSSRAYPRLTPLVAAGLAGVLMLIAACASAPPAPDSALDAAKVAITNAEKAEAGQFAAAKLRRGAPKLACAAMPCEKKAWSWPNGSHRNAGAGRTRLREDGSGESRGSK